MKFRCLDPGCGEDAIPSVLRCLEHLGSTTLEYAEEYAVEVLLRRVQASENLMSAARFDGACAYLLANEAWKEIPWLGRDALRLRDPVARGVDFPAYLRVESRSAIDPRSRRLLG